jgi:hypothetical protein
MALINEGASFPSYMWAAVRLLLALGGKSDTQTARQLLTPPSLPPGETEEFSDAIKSLADLGLVTTADGIVELTPAARTVSPANVAGFNELLRRAVLDPARNTGLAERPDADGPKDLVRALAWFLTNDPLTPLDWVKTGQLQDGAFASHLPAPIVNDFRWNRFVFWAPALGFAARSLFDKGGPVQMVPDCTVGVRETVLSLWQKGQRVNAAQAVNLIIEELPVLPGGTYSRALGLGTSGTDVSPSLSNALLTGEEQGWISLEKPSDADDGVLLSDQGDSRTRRLVSVITVNGSI